MSSKIYTDNKIFKNSIAKKKRPMRQSAWISNRIKYNNVNFMLDII